jgi:hypothetical protein
MLIAVSASSTVPCAMQRLLVIIALFMEAKACVLQALLYLVVNA